MDFADNGCLEDQVLDKTKEAFTEQEVMLWFCQIALAVQYMHEKGLIHRDIKTENIFLKGNIVKLGDFGVSTKI